jgi:16S rRNA (guanine527-N7)-methyltransferase
MNIVEEVSRETLEKLRQFVELLKAENSQQNLISRNADDDVWRRHIEDSLQLKRFADKFGRWLDVGSGGGLPGIVLAIASAQPIVLCEPRRLRANFLERMKEELDLGHVTVSQKKVEQLRGAFDYVTARAVAPAAALFAMTAHLTHNGTTFILPKGRSAQSELDEVRRSWQGNFRLEPSMTSQDARILIATDVGPKGAR